MKFTRSAAIALVLTTLATTTLAQSLESRRRYAEQEAELATKTAATGKSCGIDLNSTIDWPSFNTDEIMQKSTVSWCSAGLDALETLCSDPMGKQAVAGKIKSLTCSGAAVVSVKLTEGNLAYAFPFTSASNINMQTIQTYLEKNL